MRILIVEDETKTAAYVRKGLTEQGYAVDVAHDGLDGLHLATTTNYDLILLDVMLAGIDGWAVLRSIREHRQTPVLLTIRIRPNWSTRSAASAMSSRRVPD